MHSLSSFCLHGAVILFTCCAVSAQTAQAEAKGRPQIAYYSAASDGSSDTITFALSGGAFKSYGCKPVDPTYWVSGTGATMTISFSSPEAMPSIRVWGMNTDDAARIEVNGALYPLTTQTARYYPKVVCGTSPNAEGVAFADGLLVGANTPADGNYSYQDVQLLTNNVSTITITSVKGAGWGFAGVSVFRDAPAIEPAGTIYHEHSKSLPENTRSRSDK